MEGEYIARVTVNAMAAGRFLALVEGDHLRLTAEEADDLLRVGYVEVVSESMPLRHLVASCSGAEPAGHRTHSAQRREST